MEIRLHTKGGRKWITSVSYKGKGIHVNCVTWRTMKYTHGEHSTIGLRQHKSCPVEQVLSYYGVKRPVLKPDTFSPFLKGHGKHKWSLLYPGACSLSGSVYEETRNERPKCPSQTFTTSTKVHHPRSTWLYFITKSLIPLSWKSLLGVRVQVCTTGSFHTQVELVFSIITPLT